MKTKVDFSLSYRFGVVERIIFRLVLNGYERISEYSSVIPLFSDSVITNAICHLVNQQILSVNQEAALLTLSEPIKALMMLCHEKDFEIEVPTIIEKEMESNGIVILGESKEIRDIKDLVLRELLPDVQLEFLVNSLDFRVYMIKENSDE